MRSRKRLKSMIGASAPTPCGGCGQKIVGEGWDLVFFWWKDRWIEKVRHAFNPRCADLLVQKYRAAKMVEGIE